MIVHRRVRCRRSEAASESLLLARDMSHGGSCRSALSRRYPCERNSAQVAIGVPPPMPSDSAQRHRARAALWAGDDQRRQVHGPRGHCCRLDEEQAIPRMRPYELRTVDRRRAEIRGGSSDRLRRSASVASGLRLRQARLRSQAVPRPRAAVSTRRAPVTRRIRPSMYPCSYVTQKVRCPAWRQFYGHSRTRAGGRCSRP